MHTDLIFCTTILLKNFSSGQLVTVMWGLTCPCLSPPTPTVFLVGEGGYDPLRRQQMSGVVWGELSSVWVKHQALEQPPFPAPWGDLHLPVFHPKKLVLLPEIAAHKDILSSVQKHYLNLASLPLRSY